MRVISWNVQGRTKALPEQLKALVERQPDLVALQEVHGRTVAQWRAGLQQHGLAYSAESVTCAQTHGRKYGLLIASRGPTTQLPWIELPYQERVLSVQIATPWGNIELHNAHVPNSDKRARSDNQAHYLASNRGRILLGHRRDVGAEERRDVPLLGLWECC
jgi:exonuclease III